MVMGKWIRLVVIIGLIVAGTYWFLQRKGIAACQANGGDWSYSRWTCD